MAVTSTDFANINRAVSAYADQEYTDARRIAGTALVGTDARINGNDEDRYGTIRWDSTLGALNYSTTQTTTDTHVNVATETSDEGLTTDMSTFTAEYIKTVRTHGANQFNVTEVITGRDGAIGKVGRDFGRTRAEDEEAALRAVLRGVIRAELDVGVANAAAGQSDPDTLDGTKGFYFDVNNKAGATNGGTAGTAELIGSSTTARTAAAGANLWEAASYGFSDVEPEFFYLVIQPSVYNELRSANLIDQQDRITDGNIQFETLLGGKFRIIVSRTGLGAYGTRANVNTGSTKTSLLMLPGALSMTDVSVPNPVAFDNNESVGRGSGNREAWYRWGYVMHPRGYTWNGSKSAFVNNADATTRTAQSAIDGYDYSGTVIGTGVGARTSPWGRVENVGNLGILPIFHG